MLNQSIQMALYRVEKELVTITKDFLSTDEYKDKQFAASSLYILNQVIDLRLSHESIDKKFVEPTF